MFDENGNFIGSPRDYKFYMFQFTQYGDIFLGEKPDDNAFEVKRRPVKRPPKI